MAKRVGDVVSEQFQESEGVDLPRTDAVEPAEKTGNVEVDRVLGTLDALDGRPVGEHVAVFEAAHEALRAALAGAGGRADDAAGT